MDHKYKQKTNCTVRLYAVDGANDTLEGYVGIDAKDNLASIFNLRVMFQVDKSRKKVYFAEDSPFFYGRTDYLCQNYWRKEMPNTVQLDRFLDMGGLQNSFGTPPNLFAIPLKEMHFGSTHLSLVNRAIDMTKARLPSLVTRLEPIGKSDEGVRYAQSYLGLIGCTIGRFYPLEFLEAALTNDQFYRLNGGSKIGGGFATISSISKSTIELPDVKLIYTPVGGLSKWVK